MLYRTHVITSLTAALALAHFTNVAETGDLLFFAGVAVGSLLPDIDEPESIAGQNFSIKIFNKRFGISPMIKRVFGHRGFTHTLLCASLVFWLAYMFPSSVTLGIGVGYLFHILGDMLSISGVPLLYPFSKKKMAFGWYRTGKIGEKWIYAITWIMFVYLVYDVVRMHFV